MYCRRIFSKALPALMALMAAAALGEDLPGLSYTNSRIAEIPWSIHIVQLQRANPQYELKSVHARGRAVGLDTLRDQLGLINPATGTAAAAINGDYYLREKAYAGAPRGLQIMDGELLSGPSGEPCFWINAVGEPHLEKVESAFHTACPDGTAFKFGLNGERRTNGLELYTTEIGASTHTKGGCEAVLIWSGAGPWLPLRIGQNYTARVREIRREGNTSMESNVMVLSFGPAFPPRSLEKIEVGALLRISTESQPALHGIRMAISGGPVLIRKGAREKMDVPLGQSYEISSMAERHPRSAIGWNGSSFFLVEVDGRQKGLSVGMTLEELGKLLFNLGCEEAMNLDGGGSSTLWFDGDVRNSPADRVEREIANCLAIVKKKR